VVSGAAGSAVDRRAEAAALARALATLRLGVELLAAWDDADPVELDDPDRAGVIASLRRATQQASRAAAILVGPVEALPLAV
jgi:hypothetical protein